MKTNFKVSLFLFCSMLVLLSSCDYLFGDGADKEADYRYKIENNTVSTIEVVVEIKQHSGVAMYGNPYRYYTIAPGETAGVWNTSGLTDDEVFNEEQGNMEIYWISVSATRHSRPARLNLNSTSYWEYERLSDYKATYTLTLTEDFF